MRRFLFLALFISIALAYSQTWAGLGSDRKVTTAHNWIPAFPSTSDEAIFPETTTTVEFPTGTVIKWGSIDYSSGSNLTFVMSPNSGLSFSGTYPIILFIARWQMEVTGPVTFDVTKIQATDQYFSNNLGGAYIHDNNVTFSALGPIPVTTNFKFGTGNAPMFVWRADFRSKTPTNLTLPNELSWTLGDFDVASPLSGVASINVLPLPLGNREFGKVCSASCSVYEDCCVVNITLSGVTTINGPFNFLYDTSAIRFNFGSLSSANVELNQDLTFQSAQVSIGGTWQIASGKSILATSLPITPLGATATRAELAGTITGGTVTLNNYDQLLVQSTVDLSTKVEFSGSQVDFYGTELSGATLDISAATIAAHLDETNVNIGTLNLLTDATLTQGFIHTTTLTGGSALNFYVSSGASLTVDTFLNSPIIILESFSSILAVTSPNYAFESSVQGSKSLLLVNNPNFVGEGVPGTFPLRVGEGATLTYGSGTTAVSRQLEMYGGTLKFSTASVTIDNLIAKFRSNAAISGGVINVNSMEITAAKIVNKVLAIDTNTRLNIVGSLKVSIPTGSVATLSGAGILDASQGTIEIWSGKLIIQSDFAGSVTVRGGSVEFQKLTPSTSHNVTSVIMNGGNVESTLSSYTLPVLQWRSGSIKASKILGIQRLVILGTYTKAITAGSVLNITSIDITESTGFDAPDTVVINNVGEFYLPSGISLNGGQSSFNNYGSVIISKGAAFTCNKYLNSMNAVGVSNFARRSVAQLTGVGAVTVMNGGTIAGTVTNSAYLQATGVINGDLLNRGQIYVGNFTEDNKGLLRQLNISGTFYNTGTSTITPQVTLKISGPNTADTDLLQANVMSLGGTLNLNFTFSTKGVDVLTPWSVIQTTSYTNQFGSVASDTFEGQGRLVYTLTGAQWEFIGCHNEKNSCTTCIKQTGSSFPNGCDWCKTAGVCRAAGTCAASDAIDVITISEENQCPSPEGSTPSTDSQSNSTEVERRFEFNVGSDKIEARIRIREGDSESELRHEIDAADSGAEFRVEFEQKAGDAENRLRMRLRLIELIEYVPDATPGYQNETIVNTYNTWYWGKGFYDASPENDSRVFTLQTADGIISITIRINRAAEGGLTVNPEDVKFDVALDADAMRAAGWLRNGTDVALKAVLVSRLDTESKEGSEETAIKLGASAASEFGALFVSWVNYIQCGANQVAVVPSAMRGDNNQTDASDDSGSVATVVAFSFVDLSSKSASTQACVWDPVVSATRASAATVTPSASPSGTNPSTTTPSGVPFGKASGAASVVAPLAVVASAVVVLF